MSEIAATPDTELEVKYYLSNRRKLEEKLSRVADLRAPRVQEVNLRLDTPDHALLYTGRLLRLRQDTRSRLTYKGPGSEQGGARLRQELEFTVSDFDTALHLFEALGYTVVLMYEKYRTTYQMGQVEVDLDEMPMGDFLEIEGPDGESIRQAAKELGLDWEKRILDSYTMIFEHARASLGFKFRDLSFANFKKMRVTPEAMGVSPADLG
jgi:adenylate cyclase, class 2